MKRGGRVTSVMHFHGASRSSGTDRTARREGKQEGQEGEKTRARARGVVKRELRKEGTGVPN